MNPKRISNLIVIVISVMIAVSTVEARTPPKIGHRYPPGIAIPDRVDTRLGELKFFDGFPDKPTVEKITG